MPHEKLRSVPGIHHIGLHMFQPTLSRSARLGLTLALASATLLPWPLVAQQNPLSQPFYFCAPRTAWGEETALKPGPLKDTNGYFVEAGAENLPELQAGLRFFALPDTPENRKSVVDSLHREDLLTDGDVALTFRPNWKGTMAYPHIQMGISHAALIYTTGGKAYNLDQPLDEHYNGKFDSQLTSENYQATQAIHILRPRNYSHTERDTFRQLVTNFVQRVPTLRAKGSLPFNSDYMSPRYAVLKIPPGDSVSRFADLIRTSGGNGEPMTMYCSEFVWHILSLNEVSTKTGPVIFEPVPFLAAAPALGLAEGPLAVLQSAGPALESARKQELAREIFTESDAAQLSSGHRQVATQVAPLMSSLAAYYEVALGGPAPEGMTQAQMMEKLNAQLTPNYSPTVFFINSFLPVEDTARKFDYLYTICFVPPGQMPAVAKVALQQATTLP